MADERKKSFVDAIVKDPANLPKVKLLVGYAGKATAEGHTRIYANPELSEHIDVPNDSILHSQDVPNDPLGGKYFWVSKEAEITRRDNSDNEVKAKFLAGPLTARARDDIGGSIPAAAAPQLAPSINAICPTPTFRPDRCPSELGVCPSVDIQCATQSPFQCPPRPTIVLSQCPTRLDPICPGNSVFVCPTQPGICITHQLNCNPTILFNCPIPTRQPLCPIRTINIQECQQFTLQSHCQTQIGLCPGPGPSAVDACPSAMCGTIGITFNPLM